MNAMILNMALLIASWVFLVLLITTIHIKRPIVYTIRAGAAFILVILNILIHDLLFAGLWILVILFEAYLLRRLQQQ